MDNLKITFEHLLRYTFSGFAGILSFYGVIDKIEILFNEEYKQLLMFIVLSVLLGSILYAFSRALIIPIMDRICVRILKQAIGDDYLKNVQEINYSKPKNMLHNFIVGTYEIEYPLIIWRLRKNENSLSKNLLEWATLIHLLVNTSVSILVGIIVGLFSSSKINLSVLYLFGLCSIILFFASVYSNLRLRLTANAIIDEEHNVR